MNNSEIDQSLTETLRSIVSISNSKMPPSESEKALWHLYAGAALNLFGELIKRLPEAKS